MKVSTMKKEVEVKGKGHSRAPVIKVPFLKQSDLLFGILEEHQVGVNPLTGRQRIAPEVLEGMRQYVNVSNADEKLIRIERIKKSVREVESDPVMAKSLQLESPPLVSAGSSKAKGIVFSYNDQHALQPSLKAPASSSILNVMLLDKYGLCRIIPLLKLVLTKVLFSLIFILSLLIETTRLGLTI